ncbi:hypothetical protein C0992_001009 [Termitomyces sp. T32_za158]|nr:hypothetical protein C0992_001009 [Termitomyces sp. T32_za158]
MIIPTAGESATLMPTLSSFVSYLPRRNKPKPQPTAAVVAPAAVIDINDGLVDWVPQYPDDDVRKPPNPNPKPKPKPKPAPAPLTIPAPATATATRPTSDNSTLDTASSAVSGATFARALMANTFVLSGGGGGTSASASGSASASRDSRYRSDVSALSRTDSATLPGADFAFLQSQTQSPHRSWTLSPPPPPVPPPVPDNAEQVYVPPQTPRAPDSPPALALHVDVDVDPTAPSTPSLASAIASALALLPPTSPARDLEHVLEYYVSDPPRTFNFHPPFSPISEETSAQLSPPSPYAYAHARTRRTGTDRFFLPASAAGGAFSRDVVVIRNVLRCTQRV